MTTFSRLATILTVALASALPADAYAQPAPERGISVTVKGGMNRENAEDGLRGTSGAAGVAVAIPVGRAWTGEIELWVPGRFRDGSQEHRDIPVSLTLARAFHAGPVRPFLLGGLGFASTETTTTFCMAGGPTPAVVSCDDPAVTTRSRETYRGGTTYAVAGFGAELPLTRRLRIVPEIRTHLAVLSVIVRPSLGVKVLF